MRITNCPFCCESIQVSAVYDDELGRWYVECQDDHCNARGPSRKLRDWAIEAWNQSYRNTKNECAAAFEEGQAHAKSANPVSSGLNKAALRSWGEGALQAMHAKLFKD